MKPFLPLFALLLLLASCREPEAPGFEYFHIIYLGTPKTKTRENKGVTASTIVSVSSRLDSFMVQNEGEGAWKAAVTDSFRGWFEAGFQEVRARPAGILFDTAYDGNTYCGPEYIVEWRGARGVITQVISYDERVPFMKYFDSLMGYAWADGYRRRKLPAMPFDADGQAIRVLKALNVYDKQPMPHIPKPCTAGWDTRFLTGTWRQEDPLSTEAQPIYVTWTLAPGGRVTWRRYRGDSLARTMTFTYSFRRSDSTLLLGEISYKVVTMSQDCFVGQGGSGEDLRELRWFRASGN